MILMLQNGRSWSRGVCKDNSRFGKWFIGLMRLCINIGVCFMDALNINNDGSQLEYRY